MNFIKIIFSGILLSSLSLGCGLFQSNTPTNDGAKVVVSAMTVGVSVLDAACAQLASETQNAKLSRDCADAYNKSRTALLAAQEALTNNDKSFVCTIKVAEVALEGFADVYTQNGEALPESVLIAESLARTFAAECKE